VSEAIGMEVAAIPFTEQTGLRPLWWKSRNDASSPAEPKRFRLTS
jgi:hypothetical protein